MQSAAALQMVSISGESTLSEVLMYFGPSTKSTVRVLGRGLLAAKQTTAVV